MKRPPKPPNWKDLLSKSEAITRALESQAYLDAVRDANQRYLTWSGIFRRQDQLKAEAVWALTKMRRTESYKNVNLGPDVSISYNIPEQVYEKLHLFDKDAAGSFESELPGIPSELKQTYLISSLMEEAIASSQIEGAATTRKVAKEMLRTGRPAQTKAERMILNNYQTIRKIVEYKGKLTPEFIKELQKSMTDGTLDDAAYSGSFRTTDDVVVQDVLTGDIAYTPPNAIHVSSLIEEYCTFANNDSPFIHPVVKGILLHFLFSYIHPFYDGNGRTARAIFYWYLNSRGYWLFQFMSISRLILKSRVQYEEAYLESEADDNDVTYFILYNVKVIEQALKALRDYIKKRQNETNRALEMIIKNKKLNIRQADILQRLGRDPSKYVTIEETRTIFDVSYPTARADLLHLERLGYVIKRQVIGKQLGFMMRHSENDR